MHSNSKSHGTSKKQLHHKKYKKSHSSTSTTTATPSSVTLSTKIKDMAILTTARRLMGVRVKSGDRAAASRRDQQRLSQQTKDEDGIPTSNNNNHGPDEIKSILPQAYTGSGKNRKLVQLGAGSSIYTTEKIPTLSFGDHSATDFANPITSTHQYQRERRKQEEQLMWEHEANQIQRLQVELQNSKKVKTTKLARDALPGIEMTQELIAKSKKLLQNDVGKSKLKKNADKDYVEGLSLDGDLDIDDYDKMFQHHSHMMGNANDDNDNNADDDNNNDGDDSTDKRKKKNRLYTQDDEIIDEHEAKNPKSKRQPRQHEPEAIEERLTLKEEQLVKKIRMRAFQSNMTITRYCNQNNIAHLLPLFDMKPEESGDMGEGGYGHRDGKRTRMKRFGHGDDDNDDDNDNNNNHEVDDASARKIRELADMSDDENGGSDDNNFSDNNNWEEADMDIDAYDDGNNNNNEDDIAMDPNVPLHKKLSQVAKQKQKTTVELGNLTKPSIFVQSQPSHTSNFSLNTFDQLQQSTARGMRLNPKRFVKSDQSTGSTHALTTEEKRTNFVHRTRPMLPDATWAELGLNPAIAGKLQSHHITNPTATQKLVIPYLIRKYNQRTGRIYVPPTVAIQDYTGSGKTYAYGLPILSNVDPLIGNKMPPPNVIAAIRALQGTKVANPPPLETDSTPLDEVDPNVRIIQYQDGQIFNNPNGMDPLTNQKVDKHNKHIHFKDDFDQEDIQHNDVDTLISTRGFIDRLTNNVDIFTMSPEEWEQYVFTQEKAEQEAVAARKVAPIKRIPVGKAPNNNNNNNNNTSQHEHSVQDHSITGGLTIDASMFNSRVYSLEAIRLRRKKQIKAHLKKIFPFVQDELLDPDAPQSTLQTIMVVPTKELALQITKELLNANPTTFTTNVALQGSHQLYGDKNLHINTVKGKRPLNIRMATGQIDPVLLASLGVFLHKGADKANTDAELSPYNKKRAYSAQTGESMPEPKLSPAQKRQHEEDQKNLRPHPFVEFGKNHKHYKPDQAEYRKELREREKDHTLRVMRLRERQLQGDKLSKYEVGEIETLDQFESRRQHALDNGLEWDPEKEYAKTMGFKTDGFNEAAAEMLDDDNDDMLAGEFDFEEDPRKLMEMDDDTLMKKLDIFRTDFTKHKMFKSLSQNEQREFKSRLATIMTKNHLKQQDTERDAAIRSVHEKKLAAGGHTVTFIPHARPEDPSGHPTMREENKEQYLKEVSDLLMEQMGGERGDFIEVVRDKQPHIIVGTPSTLVNLIKSGAIQLPSTGLSPNQLKSIVFDECDHLARNETSLEHHSLLELLSLPTDQSVFVSASMTRDNARLLTRLGRRQDLFINNKRPQIETVTNMIALPRPNYKAIPEEIADGAYEAAFEYAQDKVSQFNMEIEADPMALNEMVFASPRAKKERLKVLSERLEDPVQRTALVDKIVDTMYKQHFTPLIPNEVYQQSLQQSISRGKLSYTTTGDEYGEVLFLSAEDYKAESQPSQQQLLTTSSEQLHDVHSLPIPPFVKQYYIAPPRLTNIQQKVGGKEDFKKIKSNSYLKRVLKDNLALDLICQLKLRPIKQGDQAKVTMTSGAYQHLLDSYNGPMANAINPLDPGQTLRNHQTSQHHDNTELIESMGNELGDEPGLNLNKNQQQQQQQQQQGKRPSRSPTASSVCPGTILVFFNPRREEDMVGLFRQLKETGLKVGLYCGLSDRHQKHEVLSKNDQLDVILTNDSLSRGIDFKHLSMVINVDPPRATTTFIHRSGRVGRVGGKYRKAATVVNIVDMVPEQGDETPGDGNDNVDVGNNNNNNNNNTTTTSNNNNNNNTSSQSQSESPSQDVNIPKQTATYALLKHAERTNVTVNPWPFVVTHNISRVYLRSLKSIVASDTEKQGIKKHLDRKRKTEEYIKSRNVKLHKQGIIQTRDSGVFDLAPGYSDSAFQPQLGKKSQSVAIHKIQAKVNERLRGSNSKPWIDTNEKQKGGKTKKSLKH